MSTNVNSSRFLGVRIPYRSTYERICAVLAEKGDEDTDPCDLLSVCALRTVCSATSGCACNNVDAMARQFPGESKSDVFELLKFLTVARVGHSPIICKYRVRPGAEHFAETVVKAEGLPPFYRLLMRLELGIALMPAADIWACRGAAGVESYFYDFVRNTDEQLRCLAVNWRTLRHVNETESCDRWTLLCHRWYDVDCSARAAAFAGTAKTFRDAYEPLSQKGK